MVRQALIVLLLSTLYKPVLAQEICSFQDYDAEEPPDFDCPSPEEEYMIPRLEFPSSVPVTRGRQVVAEWEGALVHRNRLLSLGLKVTGLRRLRWSDRLRLHKECQLRIDYMEGMYKASMDSITAQKFAYRDRLAVAEERITKSSAWYKHPILWFTIGFVSAGVIVALTAYALMSVDIDS